MTRRANTGFQISRCVALACALTISLWASCVHDSAEVKKGPSTAHRPSREAPPPRDEERVPLFTLVDDPGSFTRTLPSPDYASIESASVPTLSLQRSHERSIIDVKSSSDGKLIVSISKDRTVKIWNTAGVLLKTVPVPGADFRCCALSPDGTRIAVGAKDALYVLSIDGRVLHGFTGPEYDTGLVAFAPDGRTVITSGGYETVVLRDASWKARATIKAHDGFLKCVAVSPSGRFFVTCGDDTRSRDGWSATARTWNMNGGHLADLETDRPEAPAGGRGGRYLFKAAWADISHDGALIALTDERETLRIREPGGKLVREIDLTGKAVPMSCMFSPDGKGVIVRASHEFAKFGVDGAFRGLIKAVQPGESSHVSCAALTPDGRYLVAGLWGSGESDGAVRMWDSHGRPWKNLATMALEAKRVLLSPDAKRLFLEIERGERTVAWNLRRAYLEEIPEGVGFYGDGSEYRFYLDRWRNFHLKQRSGEREFKDGFVTPLPDGDILQGSGHEFIIYSRDGAAKRRVSLDIGGTGGLAPVHEIAIESAMRYFVLESMRNHGGVHEIMRFAMDGKKLGEINVEEQLSGGAICAHGDMIATGHENGIVRIWSTAGRKLKTLAGHLLPVNGLAFTADGKYLASSSADRTTRLWDLSSGSSMVLVALKDGGWIAVDESGRFECSDGAREHLHFVRGLTAYGVRQLWEKFHEPGLVAGFMKGSKAGPVSIADTLRDSPAVTARLLRARTESSDSAVVSVCVRPRDNGVGKVFIIHNGRVIDELSRGVGVQPGGECRVFTLLLEPGDNDIAGAAYDRTNSVFGTSEKLSVRYSPSAAGRPAMHILSVGVSAYRDSNINLGYPADDAAAVGSALRDTGAPLYGKINATVLVDGKATRAAVSKAMGEISRAAGKSDAVILFLAGHGDTDGETYYFLPHDADITNLRESCISSDDLGAFVRGLSANKVVLLLDTCKSGTATKAMHALAAARGFEDHRIIARIAKEHGIAVFSAASVSQDAYEIRALGHGIFTYCLLDALRASPGTVSEDGVISVARLLARVNRATRETAAAHLKIEQNPIVYMFGDDFSIGRVR